MTRPIVSGSFSATSKPVIFCGRPSSWIEKSVFGQALDEALVLVDGRDVELHDVDAHALDRRAGPLQQRRSLASLPSSPIAVARRSSPREYSLIGIVTS